MILLQSALLLGSGCYDPSETGFKIGPIIYHGQAAIGIKCITYDIFELK